MAEIRTVVPVHSKPGLRKRVARAIAKLSKHDRQTRQEKQCAIDDEPSAGSSVTFVAPKSEAHGKSPDTKPTPTSTVSAHIQHGSQEGGRATKSGIAAGAREEKYAHSDLYRFREDFNFQIPLIQINSFDQDMTDCAIDEDLELDPLMSGACDEALTPRPANEVCANDDAAIEIPHSHQGRKNEDGGVQLTQETELQITPKDEPSPIEKPAAPLEAQSPRTRASSHRPGKYHCNICLDDYNTKYIFPLQCGHWYCIGCVKTLFRKATADESLFPPTCCGQISVQSVQYYLSAEELKAFSNAEIEYSTDDRTYCSNTKCGKFILPVDIDNERAKCRACSTETCMTCKEGSHDSSICPKDTAVAATMFLAHEQGWKRCQSCRALVELDDGCNHMSCRCGASFCYVCNVPHKECPFGEWDKKRPIVETQSIVKYVEPLPQATEEIQPREENSPKSELPETQPCEEKSPTTLREKSQCAHQKIKLRFSYTRRSSFSCRICDRRHRRCIFSCNQCRTLICESCRRSEL